MNHSLKVLTASKLFDELKRQAEFAEWGDLKKLRVIDSENAFAFVFCLRLFLSKNLRYCFRNGLLSFQLYGGT